MLRVPAPARRTLQDSQDGFAGGLNATSSEFSVAANQVRRAENAVLSQVGDVARRLGTQRMMVSGFSNTIRGGCCWRRASDHEYLVVTGGNIWTAGSYSLPMNFTHKGTVGASSVYPHFEPFRDATSEALYIAAAGTLKKYKAGTLSTPAGPVSGLSVLAVYNQRLFGVTGADQSLHYSSLNDGDTVGVVSSTSGSVIIRTFSDQKITGLLALKQSLAIFHVGGISRWTGITQDDIAIQSGTQAISGDTGSIAPRSIIAVEGEGYFLSERGAFKVTDSGIEALDRPAAPDPTIPLLVQLSAAQFAQIDAVHDKAGRTVRWYIPDVGLYVWHYRLGAWTGPHTGIYTQSPVHCLFDGIDSNGAPVLFAGHDDANLRRMDVPGSYLDDVRSDGTTGGGYVMAITMRRFYTGDPSAAKAWRWCNVYGDLGGSMAAVVSWTSDTGSGSYTIASQDGGVWDDGGLWDDGGVWGSGGNQSYQFGLSERGTYLDVIFADEGSAPTVLSRVSVEAMDYGRRG